MNHRNQSRALPWILAACLFTGVWAALVPASLAQPPVVADTIVVVGASSATAEGAWPEAERAIAQEFRLLGIPVVETKGVPDRDADRVVELERLAVAWRAVAAIAIRRASSSASSIELWINDRVTGKMTYRQFTIKGARSSDAAMVVALRAVDTLRASLLELRMESPRSVDHAEAARSREVVAPSARIAALSEETAVRGAVLPIRTVGIAVGGTALGSPGGAGVRGGFSMSLEWRPIRFGGLALDGAYLPFGGEVSGSGATTVIRLGLLRGWIILHFRDRNVLRPCVLIGGGSVFATGKGERSEDRPLVSDNAAVGYLGAGGRLDIALGPRFRLDFGVYGGATLPEVTVVHGDSEVARLGRPLVEVVARIEVGLP